MLEEFEFRRIGVVGLGLMGLGIAQVLATAGYEVKALDTEKVLVDHSLSRIAAALEKMVRKNVIQELAVKAILARIDGSVDLGVVRYCDLIIEAIHEDRDAKRDLFSQLDDLCPETTLFASNTSTFAISGLASGLRRVDKFLGLHFFTPVPIMKLVEVVKTAVTSDQVIERALHFIKTLQKTPILVRDQAGFLVNYLLTPYLLDAIRSPSSGLGAVDDIDSAMRYGCGHPMGPGAVGPDRTGHARQCRKHPI